MVLALFLLDEQQFHSSERERELPGLPPTCERVKGFGDKGGNAREKLGGIPVSSSTVP